MYKVLVIEDDVMMCNMLAMYLAEEGYHVVQANSAAEGLSQVEQFVPHLVLLDLVLPDMDGLEVCAQMRKESTVPIMILSAKNEVSERVQALRAGADDFLCKPFSMHELTARIEALIRRSFLPHSDELWNEAIIQQTDTRIQLDHERRVLLVQGKAVETTFSEYELLKLFLAHPDKVFSREELINEIRGFNSYVTDRSIDVHIVNLRKKIEPNPREPVYLRTVWGFGYKYTTPAVSVT